MKTIKLTKENFDLLIGCLEESMEKTETKMWDILDRNGHNEEDARVKSYQGDLDKMEILHKELVGW